MFGLISLFTSFLMLSWRYILSALLGGMTLLACFIADRILLADTPIDAKMLAESLLTSTLYNAFFLAICAIPFSFSLILLGRLFRLKTWLYYATAGAISGYGALWILVHYFDKTHISLAPNAPELITTISGGLITGIFYRIIAVK